MEVIEPQTDAEWESFNDLRWRTLRAPWGQPRGEEDEPETVEIVHAMISDDAGRAVAIGRIIFWGDGTAQIRSMATEESCRGRGLGRQIMAYLEQAARERGKASVWMHARDVAEGFYAKLGYRPIGQGPTLFHEIPHTTMQKEL